MWCLFSIISHGMTAVCCPYFFAAVCRRAASMMERYDERQGHGSSLMQQRFAGGLLQCWKGMTCGKGVESRL